MGNAAITSAVAGVVLTFYRGGRHRGRIAVFELTRIDQSLGQDIAAGIGIEAILQWQAKLPRTEATKKQDITTEATQMRRPAKGDVP